MNIVVTGSIAYDYLMSFPGKFTEHLLADHLQKISLSFLVETMDKRRGGCAPNIAYTLALLGERPRLLAAAGQDFGEYRAWLDAAGIDTSLVRVVQDKFTASFFCSTDEDSNQIASFYNGAMSHAGELSFRTVGPVDLAIVAPNDPGAMVQYAEECRTLGIPYIFDPGQQCPRLSGDDMRDGISGARLVVCNDYEFELIRQKTGWDEGDVLRAAEILVVTRGENGSSLYQQGMRTDVRAVSPHRIVDPTGVGDAYRGAFMYGIAAGAPLEVCAQLGSVAATYCLEHLGPMSHAYGPDEFRARYREHFGALELA
jgi:adenosine kinase